MMYGVLWYLSICSHIQNLNEPGPAWGGPSQARGRLTGSEVSRCITWTWNIYIHHDDMCRFNISVQVQTCLYMVQTCLYRFAKSCPGGQDSKPPGLQRSSVPPLVFSVPVYNLLEHFQSRFQMWTIHFSLNATFLIGFGNRDGPGLTRTVTHWVWISHRAFSCLQI